MSDSRKHPAAESVDRAISSLYDDLQLAAPKRTEQVADPAEGRGRRLLLVVLAVTSVTLISCAPLAWQAWRVYGAFDAMVFDASRVIPAQREAVARLMEHEVVMLRDRTRSVRSIVAIESTLDDADFDAILALTTARELYLSDSTFPAERLADLRRLPELQALYLACVDLSNGRLEHVSQLHQLVALDLRATGIDDNSLANLHQLPNLRFVDLAGTPVTTEGVEDLEQAIPDLSINLDDTDKRYVKW